MDPNEALRQLRSEIATLSVACGPGDPLWPIVEHFHALDGWLSKGGFLPDAWNSGPYKQLRESARLGQPEPLGGPVPGVNGSHLPGEGEH